MSMIEADASQHFKDIFHELVDYKNFKPYLHNMTKTTHEMANYKILYVLKDPTVNICSLLFTCQNAYAVNKDDELVL